MSDRCYLSLYIHGHIKTVDDLQAIAIGIAAEGLRPQYPGDNMQTIVDTFAMAVHGQIDVPEFYADEINYANLDEAETALRLAGVAYVVSHGSGAEYPAGSRSWTPERGYFSTVCSNDGTAFVEIDDIERTLTEEDPIAHIKQLILETRWANGMDMPSFSVSDEVKVQLAKTLACKVLEIPDANDAAVAHP